MKIIRFVFGGGQVTILLKLAIGLPILVFSWVILKNSWRYGGFLGILTGIALVAILVLSVLAGAGLLKGADANSIRTSFKRVLLLLGVVIIAHQWAVWREPRQEEPAQKPRIVVSMIPRASVVTGRQAAIQVAVYPPPEMPAPDHLLGPGDILSLDLSKTEWSGWIEVDESPRVGFLIDFDAPTPIPGWWGQVVYPDGSKRYLSTTEYTKLLRDPEHKRFRIRGEGSVTLSSFVR